MFVLCIRLDKHLLDLIKHQKRSCAAEAGCSVLVQGKMADTRRRDGLCSGHLQTV